MSDGSIIGRTTTIRGRVTGTGAIRVEGYVEGDVVTDGNVEVASEAQIQGAVRGATLRVAGTVAGDLIGTEAVLLELGARVVGDLSAPRIGIAEGALLRGKVETSRGGAAAPAARGAVAVRREPEVPRAVVMRSAAAPGASARAATVSAPVASPPAPPPARDAAPKTTPTGARPAPAAAPRAPVGAPRTRPGTDSAGRTARAAPPPPVVPSLAKGARVKKKKAGHR